MAATTEQSTTDTLSGPTTPIASSHATASNEAASKLVEAIDDFLGDIEKKFKTISEEILGKLDDMAERCDRLEQEMLGKDLGRNNDEGSVAGGSIS